MINLQNSIRPFLKYNTQWLGAPGVASSRYYWTIPVTGGANIRIGVTANSNPGGSANYRMSSIVYASRQINYSGAAETDYAEKYTVYETPAKSSAPVLDIQVELDSVGGGTSAAYSVQGRNLIISIPDSYTNYALEADFEV